MIPPIKKLPAFLLAMILLLSLCNTSTVFATGSIPSEPNIQPDTVSTAEELINWLKAHESTGGTVKMTADIFLDDLTYLCRFKMPVTIDTGAFSIIAIGRVEFFCPGLTICGQGGERGVLRAALKGGLSISYLTVKADAGYTVVQEEGAGFFQEESALDKSSVHYAKTPFVWDLRSELAIVERGQMAIDVLPATLSLRVNRQGDIGRHEEVPIGWELLEHEIAEEQRLRFTALGVIEGFASFEAPICTVVYNDFPLTFTEVRAMENEQFYQINTAFTTNAIELPIEVSKEYSFDGTKWAVLDVSSVESFTSLEFTFLKYEDEVMWDSTINPWLYIRIHWCDGEIDRYSNVLRFSGEDFGEADDIGGNRGGGTDIISPPTEPELTPDPKPEQPAEPELMPDPKPEQPAEPEPTPDLTPDPKPKQSAIFARVTGVSVPPIEELPATIQNVSPDGTMSNLPLPAEVMSETNAETMTAGVLSQQPEDKKKLPFVNIIPIVAGGTAIAAIIGAAGIYHSPNLRKQLLGALKKLLRAKK